MNSMPDDHLPVRDALSTDAVIRLARERWRALGEVNALFTRPWIGLDTEGARDRIDRDGLLAKFAGPDLEGRRVLVIGGGGGQQSLAFGLLGASVTVVDFDEGQLDRDRRTWSARLLPPDRLRTLQLDMRELGSCNLEPGSFDIVWHPYSINFVPDCH
ncbi:MAG: methyltransferase domain-containing protein, partial [bacterium]